MFIKNVMEDFFKSKLEIVACTSNEIKRLAESFKEFNELTKNAGLKAREISIDNLINTANEVSFADFLKFSFGITYNSQNREISIRIKDLDFLKQYERVGLKEVNFKDIDFGYKFRDLSIGDVIYISNPGHGAMGCENRFGRITTSKSDKGLLDKDEGFNVQILNSSDIWRVNPNGYYKKIDDRDIYEISSAIRIMKKAEVSPDIIKNAKDTMIKKILNINDFEGCLPYEV